MKNSLRFLGKSFMAISLILAIQSCHTDDYDETMNLKDLNLKTNKQHMETITVRTVKSNDVFLIEIKKGNEIYKLKKMIVSPESYLVNENGMLTMYINAKEDKNSTDVEHGYIVDNDRYLGDFTGIDACNDGALPMLTQSQDNPNRLIYITSNNIVLDFVEKLIVKTSGRVDYFECWVDNDPAGTVEWF